MELVTNTTTAACTHCVCWLMTAVPGPLLRKLPRRSHPSEEGDGSGPRPFHDTDEETTPNTRSQEASTVHKYQPVWSEGGKKKTRKSRNTFAVTHSKAALSKNQRVSQQVEDDC